MRNSPIGLATNVFKKPSEAGGACVGILWGIYEPTRARKWPDLMKTPLISVVSILSELLDIIRGLHCKIKFENLTFV